MKPCFKNRKLITLLALDSLEPDRAATLRQHLQACERCQAYYNELFRVTAALSAPEEPSDIEPGASFHKQLVSRVKAPGPPGRARVSVADLLRATVLNWRVALPAAAGISVVLGILLAFPKPRETTIAGVSIPSKTASFKLNRELPPTFANYQMVANHSLDRLDELLSDQGSRNLPSAPLYTGSSW